MHRYRSSLMFRVGCRPLLLPCEPRRSYSHQTNHHRQPRPDWYGPADLPQDMVARRRMTPREERIEALALEVFSRGNQYLKTVFSLESLPEGIHSFPEVAFVGAPSSGKSSLICALCHNRRIVKSGKKQGVTRQLSFVNVGDALALVDCPGYGNWIDVEDRKLRMARGIGIMFQYLALRSRGNLRRVYWVMEASKSHKFFRPTPRDEELLRFLYTERIPFSIVLNKVDRYGIEDHNRLVCDVGAIYDFLGTDSVPILDTCANTFSPQEHRNIDKLRNDITLHVCNQLRDIEITFKGLRSLSYMPFTVEEQLRVEERYPMRSILLPYRDDISIPEMIRDHEKAKLAFVEFHRLDAKEMAPMQALEMSAHGGLVGVREKTDALVTQVMADATQWRERGKREHASRLIWGAAVGPQAAAIAASSSPPTEVLASSSLTLPSSERSHGHESLSLIGDGSTLAPSSSATVVDEESTATAVASPSLEGGANPSVPFSDMQPRPSPTLEFPVSALGGVMPASAAVASAHGGPPPILTLPRGMAEAFPFRFVPESMISAFFERDLGKVESRSLGALEQSMKHTTYEAYLDDAYEPFLQESPDDVTRSRNNERKAVLDKYLNSNKKARYRNLDSASSMCPWLGRPREGSVLGLGTAVDGTGEASSPSAAHSGTVVRALKSRGFGGRSVSPNTLRYRGRATQKVGRWAR